MIPALVFIGLVVLVGVIWLIATHNNLVSLRQQSMNAWSQIDVQLKRRYDLIPNLVETVKGYMEHEQETLEKVIQARNRAISADSVNEQSSAEGALTAALSGFFALAEAYPDLKANTNMIQLQEELRGTESKISMARQYYNDVVTAYNIKLEAFPSSIIANMGNFRPKELFEIEDPVERENIKVEF